MKIRLFGDKLDIWTTLIGTHEAMSKQRGQINDDG